MNAITSCFDYWNRKVRTLNVVDLKLIQFGSMALILILAKLFPQITSPSIWWFAAVAIICLARPFYVFWIRADDAVALLFVEAARLKVEGAQAGAQATARPGFRFGRVQHRPPPAPSANGLAEPEVVDVEPAPIGRGGQAAHDLA